MNPAQSNELMLWLLLAIVAVVVLGMALEYFSRRWRYFWRMRRTTDKMLPRFNVADHARLNPHQKVHGH